MAKVFISYSIKDYVIADKVVEHLKKNGIDPWIDNEEIQAGDPIYIKINKGIESCTHLLLLWSSDAKQSKMVGEEWNAAFRKKMVIVGRLDDTEPPELLGAHRWLNFRNFDDAIRELIKVLQNDAIDYNQETFKIIFKSVHAGKTCHLIVQQEASVSFLAEEARKAFNLKIDLDTGGFNTFPIRWVLIHADEQAREAWYELSRQEQHKVKAVIYSQEGPKFAKKGIDQLKDIGVYDGIIFNLHFIEDIDRIQNPYIPSEEHKKIIRDSTMVANSNPPPLFEGINTLLNRPIVNPLPWNEAVMPITPRAISMEKKTLSNAKTNRLQEAYENTLIEKGMELYKQRNFEGAIKVFDEAIQYNAENKFAWNNKADCLNELELYDEALLCCDRAIKLDQNFAVAWGTKGQILFKLKRYKDALECFDETLKKDTEFFKRDSDFAVILFYRAFSLEYLERFEDAVDMYHQFISLSPSQDIHFVKESKDRINIIQKKLSKELP